MDYEKKYKEALEKAKAWCDCEHATTDDKILLKRIFSELKESEDERIRKAIISFLKSPFVNENITDEKVTPWIAWLEKQQNALEWAISFFNMEETKKDAYNKAQDRIGYLDRNPSFNEGWDAAIEFARQHIKIKEEQKPVDTVEPKFKKGDWVVYTGYLLKDSGKEIYVMQVASVEDDRYNFTDTSTLCFDSEKDMRLWTIEDAKDGDVLCTYECCEPKIVFILKGTPKKHYALSYYCYYNVMYPHFGSDFKKGCLAPNDEDVKPATKEQRDRLEKAMADAGYTFDFEKKELKKIEQKPVFEMKTPEESLGIDSDTYNKIVDECVYGEQNPAWSEEDEEHIESILKRLDGMCKKGATFTKTHFAVNQDIDWLKSLKDRVQPKQEWSMYDETILKSLIDHFEYKKEFNEAEDYDIVLWLKSLRPQNGYDAHELLKEGGKE